MVVGVDVMADVAPGLRSGAVVPNDWTKLCTVLVIVEFGNKPDRRQYRTG